MEGDLSPGYSQGNPSIEDVESEVVMEEANEVLLVREDVLIDTSTGQEGNVGGSFPFVTSLTAQVCSALCFWLNFFAFLLPFLCIYLGRWRPPSSS